MATIPNTEYYKSKTSGECWEYLSNLGSLIMNGAFTYEIKSRMSMTKTAFNNKSHLG
jgi:hypothetical protein